MAGAQVELHARRLVYLGKQKENMDMTAAANLLLPSTSRGTSVNRKQLSNSEPGCNKEDLLLQKEQSSENVLDEEGNMFLDAGETMLPECRDAPGGAQHEQEQGSFMKLANFNMLSKLPEAQPMAMEPSSPSPLSLSPVMASATLHSCESQALSSTAVANSMYSSSPAQLPAVAMTITHKVSQEKEESGEEEGYVSLTSCAIILISLGLRALRHLIHSYQNFSLKSERASAFPRESKLLSSQKLVVMEKASTHIDFTSSSEEFHDTEESKPQDASVANSTKKVEEEEKEKQQQQEQESPKPNEKLRQTDPGVPIVRQKSRESSERAFLQGRGLYSRTHSMLTVHTPDLRGFLGLPKSSGPSGEVGVKQIDRLGARLSHMMSKSNYGKPLRSEAGKESIHSIPSTHSMPPRTQPASTWEVPVAKPVERETIPGHVLMPPPSPLPPSESWFAATTSSKKPLGTFIREKHAGSRRKSASFEEIPPRPSNNSQQMAAGGSKGLHQRRQSFEELPPRPPSNKSQRMGSSKDLFQRRQPFRPTMQAA
jgi:hypothetical protein